jgi:hypothetical protein
MIPSTEIHVSTKGIRPSSTKDMSKVDEALVLELKNGKNTNVVPLTKYNISEESWTKRGSRRINSTISNQDDHPNFVSILKDDNLIPIPEITSLKFHRAKPEK